MERRNFFKSALAFGAGILAAARAFAEEKLLPSDAGATRPAAKGDVVELPAFEKDGTVTLEQALLRRKTERDFTGDPLTLDQVSRILWATTGVNRTDGHRTTPSAVASYPIDLYVALQDGVYLFKTKEHRLERVLSDDIRSKVPSIQPGLKRAGMTLIYCVQEEKSKGESAMRWADIEIGCMVQNTFLQAAAMGLGSCVFGLVSYKKVAELLGIKNVELVRIGQAVGPLK